MPKNPEDLADYVRRVVKEAGVSYREVEETAKKKGFHISNGYVSKIVSRAAVNLSIEKLCALAAGLNRPEEEVFAVARGEKLTEEKISEATMNAVAFNYGKLTKKDREAIAPLLRALQREIDERLDKAKE